MAERSTIVSYCSTTLDAYRFRDAAHNGLQVEGGHQIERLATSVSVNEEVIRQAVDWNAHALLVHHGMLWGGRLGPIVGPTRKRLALLLTHDINLIAYHLPLDADPQFGNNAELARALDLEIVEPFADVDGQSIGFITKPRERVLIQDLVARVADVTGRRPAVLPGGPADLNRIAVLSGSGYSALDEAVAKQADVLITGDVREPTMALAREMGITVVVAGHEATERLGVQALAGALAREFELETRFIPDPNPI